jgi:hypothetical protein
VGEEALVGIGPKQAVERFDPFDGASLDRGAPATLQRLFEEAGQHLVERLAAEMIEQHLRPALLAHDLPLPLS